MALVVFSHWILDFIVWDNLPVFFDKTHVVGLGFYDKIGFSLTGLKMDSGTIIAPKAPDRSLSCPYTLNLPTGKLCLFNFSNSSVWAIKYPVKSSPWVMPR